MGALGDSWWILPSGDRYPTLDHNRRRLECLQQISCENHTVLQFNKTSDNLPPDDVYQVLHQVLYPQGLLHHQEGPQIQDQGDVKEAAHQHIPTSHFVTLCTVYVL